VVPRVQKTAFCCIQSATTGFTANAFPYHIRVSLKEAFEGPEPDDGKLSRPVLRGPAPSNGGWLLGEQMCLFADRLSTDEMQGNQLRLYFSALAYTLVEALRRLALTGTEWAQAQVDTVRRKLFKIGAIVHVSVRRIRLQMSSAYPWKDIYARAFHALRC